MHAKQERRQRDCRVPSYACVLSSWRVGNPGLSPLDLAIAPNAKAVCNRWTVLFLREFFMRSHRFKEIQAQAGDTPQMVAEK